MKIQTIITGCCLLVCLVSRVWSARVYSWTDADGVTHYSETAPDGEQLEVTVLEIVPPVVAAPADDDYYSVANQAGRMEARRLEKERLRAEILRAEAEARKADADAAAAARTQSAEQTRDRYPLYPWYPYSGHRPYPAYQTYPRFPRHKPHHRPSRNKKIVIPPGGP